MEFLDYFDRYPELTPTDLAISEARRRVNDWLAQQAVEG